MATMKAGYGFHVGQDFGRLTDDTEFEVTERNGSVVFGYMTPATGIFAGKRVKVSTNRAAIIEQAA